MQKKELTEIVCILDRSGSMSNIVDDVIGGFNTFINEQLKIPGDENVTVILFDDRYEIFKESCDIKTVPHLDKNIFIPRGMTALFHAIGRTINTVGERLAKTDETKRPERVIFAILTDGAENASKEFNRTKIFEMINHQKEKYSWEFIFLAANQDAIAAGTSIGISFDKCANFDPTQKGAQDSFAKMAYATSSYRTLGVIDSSWKDVTLSDE